MAIEFIWYVDHYKGELQSTYTPESGLKIFSPSSARKMIRKISPLQSIVLCTGLMDLEESKGGISKSIISECTCEVPPHKIDDRILKILEKGYRVTNELNEKELNGEEVADINLLEIDEDLELCEFVVKFWDEMHSF